MAQMLKEVEAAMARCPWTEHGGWEAVVGAGAEASDEVRRPTCSAKTTVLVVERAKQRAKGPTGVARVAGVLLHSGWEAVLGAGAEANDEVRRRIERKQSEQLDWTQTDTTVVTERQGRGALAA